MSSKRPPAPWPPRRPRSWFGPRKSSVGTTPNWTASTDMHRQTILLATLCGLLLAAPALGQVALPSIERNAPEWDSNLAATARYQKDAGIAAGGRFETLEFEALAWAEGPLTDNIQFNLLASYA